MKKIITLNRLISKNYWTGIYWSIWEDRAKVYYKINKEDLEKDFLELKEKNPLYEIEIEDFNLQEV